MQTAIVQREDALARARELEVRVQQQLVDLDGMTTEAQSLNRYVLCQGTRRR